jgi:hypothetical protein
MPQPLALRSRIVLAAADGLNNQHIAAALKLPPITVGKWRQSFALFGIEALRESPRSGRPPKHDSETRVEVQTRVCQQPIDQSRWTVRTRQPNSDCPPDMVRGMLVAALILKPGCWTLSVYISTRPGMPSCCVGDEKRSIKALDRTQPLLPLIVLENFNIHRNEAVKQMAPQAPASAFLLYPTHAS